MQNILWIDGKMTLTFNSEKYKDLLCQYQPKIIKTEAENEAALKVVEQLMHSEQLTPEEDELYSLLIRACHQLKKRAYFGLLTTYCVEK